MGIGVAFFTEIVGAGPVKNCDILGLGMFDSCEIRIHPTGSAIARLGTISQGQGHATTFAQILASEIGIPADMMERIWFPMISGRPDGTGLGLAITQTIVGQHGGVIECVSQPGDTCFSVFLPFTDNGLNGNNNHD